MVLEYSYPLFRKEFDRLEPWTRSLSESSLSDPDDLVLYTRHGGPIVSVCDALVDLINPLTDEEYDHLSHRDVLRLNLGNGLFLGFSHIYYPQVKVGDLVVRGSILAFQDPYFDVGFHLCHTSCSDSGFVCGERCRPN